MWLDNDDGLIFLLVGLMLIQLWMHVGTGPRVFWMKKTTLLFKPVVRINAAVHRRNR